MRHRLPSSRVALGAALLAGAAFSACGGGQPESTSTPASMAPAGSGTVALDPSLPVYQPTSGISGNLSSVGADTMNHLMTLWGETFSRMYPNVRLQVEGKGSSTAPPALIAGTAQFGPMSQPMEPTEIHAFEKKYGYKPTEVRTSFDALAIFVNRDNPLEKLTLAQADAVFSKTRRRGAARDIGTWGGLGLTGEWANRPISLYGRNSASGTYEFFKEHVLQNGDYKDTIKEQPGSASAWLGITADRYGMGYIGMGYKTSGVKVVALAEKEGAAASSGSYEDVIAGTYPLSRYLYLYVNRAPGRPLDPLVREFLKMVVSKQGQEVVVKVGYLPLTAEIVAEERAKFE